MKIKILAMLFILTPNWLLYAADPTNKSDTSLTSIRRNSDSFVPRFTEDPLRPASPGRSGLSVRNKLKQSVSLPSSPRFHPRCEAKKDVDITFFEKKIRQVSDESLTEKLNDLKIFKKQSCILKEDINTLQVSLIATETTLKEIQSQISAKKTQRRALKGEIKNKLSDMYDLILGSEQLSQAKISSAPTDGPDSE